MIRIIFYIFLSLLFLNGCATLELETNVKMTKSVFLKPIKKDKKTIYISIKSITGNHLDILPLLKKDLQAKHYKIVENPEEAQYVLMVNILFANNLKEAYAIRNGAALGVTSGIIAAGSGSSTKGSLLVGATVALASGLVSKALEDETYRAVVDIVLDEKSDISNEKKKSVMGEKYKEHRTRILAEAVQANLKLNEALPILSQKVAKQLSNIF